jgi:lipopolysaccharide assembly outer membrane protein LptD (OstA)
VLTSFEDQSDAPLFDTTPLDFSFASLFRPNRFTGYDRIGDENRLTLGLTSRTIANQTGQELFRASVGQIYFFEDRRVQLSGDSVEGRCPILRRRRARRPDQRRLERTGKPAMESQRHRGTLGETGPAAEICAERRQRD